MSSLGLGDHFVVRKELIYDENDPSRLLLPSFEAQILQQEQCIICISNFNGAFHVRDFFHEVACHCEGSCIGETGRPLNYRFRKR